MKIRHVVPAALVAVIAGSGAAGVVAITSANASEAHVASATLQVRQTSLGKIHVNSAGHTVYMFVKDKKGSNTSACTGSCLIAWPLVTVSGKPTAGPGVNAKLITTFRVGSKTEVAYNGYPLYTWAGDHSPGQTTGQGLNNSGGLWYVLNAAGGIVKTK